MATNTYVALDKVTISGSSTNTVTFNTFGSSYTDLVLITDLTTTGAGASYYCLMRFNSDSGSNYSYTNLSGNGTTAISDRGTNTTGVYTSYAQVANPDRVISNIYIQNYSNSNTYKTTLVRSNSVGQNSVSAMVETWRNTAAITSITLTTTANNFGAGSTFSLYGIQAWAAETSTKATGGYVTSDSTYWYHTFPFTGTFTPSQSISADILVVAGGGGGAGGGGSTSAGGGGGGYRAFTSQSLSSGVAYTCTIGSGGAGGTAYTANASNGTNSSFAGSGFTTISATGGGGGGAYDKAGNSGGSGGGGGGAGSYAGGAGNAGSYSPVEGYAGGSGLLTYPNYCSGGGGGAAAVGGNATTTSAGAGGAGKQWLDNNYYAGGGGGSSNNGIGQNAAGGIGGGGTANTTNSALLHGAVSTGGGGAGITNIAGNIGGSGGSGVVIVRYAK